jgi:hypothetical protein
MGKYKIGDVELNPDPEAKAASARRDRIEAGRQLVLTLGAEIIRVGKEFAATSSPGPRRELFRRLKELRTELERGEAYLAKLRAEEA